jgi:hypothetical protein
MTEADWLSAEQPPRMLDFLGRKAAVRPRRLFACACVRRIWHLLADPRSRRAVEVAEAFADGEATREARQAALREAKAASRLDRSQLWSPSDAAEILLLQSTEDISTAARAVAAASFAGVPPDAERAAQSALVRDIFGNPFRPFALDHACLTPTVLSLTAAAYEARSLPSGELEAARLAILADALEEAGCAAEDVLAHLRGPGPHVRGCAALDLMLGKRAPVTRRRRGAGL